MKVLNFGSLNIDYVYQMAHFIRPGETAPCKTLTAGCGGKGLNQSIALAKAGTEVYHAGLYGGEAQFLLDKMQTAGVDTSLLRLGEGANGHAIIQVDENGQNCIILYGGTNRQITESYVDEVLAHFEAGDVLVLQNEINCMPYIMQKAHEKGLRIAFNAAPYGAEVLSYHLETVTWLIVNEVEGAGISGKTDFDDIADTLVNRYPGTAGGYDYKPFRPVRRGGRPISTTTHKPRDFRKPVGMSVCMSVLATQNATRISGSLWGYDSIRPCRRSRERRAACGGRAP